MSEEYLNIRPVAVAYAWPLCAKRDDIHKTRSTEHTALLSEEDQATAAGNMHIKFEFEYMLLDTRADRRTDTLIAVLCSPEAKYQT